MGHYKKLVWLYVVKPLAKSILIPLGLIAAASTADSGTHKKILGLAMTTLIISNWIS